MIKELLDVAADERVHVPELINLHEVRVIAGEDEIGIIFEKQVGNVVQVRKPGERGGFKAIAHAEFVAEQPGGLGHVVNEMCALGCGIGNVDDQ